MCLRPCPGDSPPIAMLADVSSPAYGFNTEVMLLLDGRPDVRRLCASMSIGGMVEDKGPEAHVLRLSW